MMEETASEKLNIGINARKCTDCGNIKHFEKFRKCKYSKYNRRANCIKCQNKKKRVKREIDRLSNIEIQWVDEELLMESFNAKVCTECDNLIAFDNFYNKSTGKHNLTPKCKSCINKINKKWTKNNRSKVNKLNKNWRENNPKKVKKIHQKYREENPEKIKKAKEKWKTENPNYHAEYTKNRYENNIQFKLKRLHSSRLRKFIDNKTKRTFKYLGCSLEKFKEYIANQFEDGMSWDNHGNKTWHLDHIIPCTAFDLNDEKQLSVCFHYSNFQPLWYDDNVRKSNSIPNLFKKLNKNDIKELCKNQLVIN